MKISKKLLIALIKKSKGEIKLTIAHSNPNDFDERIDYDYNLNDFILKEDGTLELWHNTGYEI